MTSTLSKVAEGFVIDKELKSVPLSAIDPAQFGFIPGSCTTFALISMFHHWLHATDGTGSTVRTALLDFSKAFESWRETYGCELGDRFSKEQTAEGETKWSVI